VALGNLAQRALVAVIAVPIIIAVLYYVQRPEPWWALVFIASVIAMREFFVMTLPREDLIPALAIGAVACGEFYWLQPITVLSYGNAPPALALGPSAALIVAVIAPALYYLFRFRDIATVATRFTATVTGIVYAGLLTTFLALLKLTGGGDAVVLVLVVAWIADTGAYFAGRFLGKTKLYEAVSPNKTWAGAFGGLAGSLVGAAALKLVSASWLSWLDVVAIAIPGGILGQLGDLAESLLKRSVGVKDSGTLLPGHGGLLDGIDAVLFIAPYTYAYLVLVH